MPNYFINGMMEFYISLSDAAIEASEGKKGSSFVEQKFLGKRRRKVPKADDDDIFVRILFLNLGRRTLLKNIDSEEYFTRNNGDVYRWTDKCGKISKGKRKVNGKVEVVTTLKIDELAGQSKHEIDVSQPRMYGIVARTTQYDESENYLSNNLLLASQEHQTFFVHYRREDDDERVDTWSKFYVSDRMTTTESELKRIKEKKSNVWTSSISAAVPPLDKEVAGTQTKMVEY